MQITENNGTYGIIFRNAEGVAEGVGLLYSGRLIGTYVLKRKNEVGTIRISFLSRNEIIIDAVTLNCTLRWERTYIKR